jgi:hypothetical protein
MQIGGIKTDVKEENIFERKVEMLLTFGKF